MAAPEGNRNAAKSRLFEQALVRAIKQRDIKAGDGETLRKAVEALIDKAAEGDMAAIRELRDTLDGKPRQQTEIIGPIPGQNAGTLAERGERIIVAMGEGSITPDQAVSLLQALAAQARVIETTDLENRISALEAKHAAQETS